MRHYIHVDNFDKYEIDFLQLISILDIENNQDIRIPNHYIINGELEYDKNELNNIESYYDNLSEYGFGTDQYFSISTINKLLKYIPKMTYTLQDKLDQLYLKKRMNITAKQKK